MGSWTRGPRVEGVCGVCTMEASSGPGGWLRSRRAVWPRRCQVTVLPSGGHGGSDDPFELDGLEEQTGALPGYRGRAWRRALLKTAATVGLGVRT